MAFNSPQAEFFASRFFAGIPHMRAAGVEVAKLEPSTATLVLPANPDWMGDPGRGMMHPGPLTMLADSACGAAVAMSLDRVQSYATLDLRMDWLRPAGPDRDVRCTAECFRMTNNIAFTRGTLWQVGDEAPIATALATFMRGTASKPLVTTASANGSASADSGGTDAATSTKPAQDAPGAWAAPEEVSPIGIGKPLPYIDFLGMQASYQPGEAPLYRLPYQEKLIGNPSLPALHGGVVAAFAESAAILHLVETLPKPKFPKIVDFSIDYLRPARPLETFARCEIVRVGSRVALVQAWCWQTSPSAPIALTRGHFLLTEADAG